MKLVDKPLCPLCGSPHVPRHAGLRDLLFGAPGEWRMVACANPDCGLLWLDPLPAEDDILAAYQSYYTHAAPPAKWGWKQWVAGLLKLPTRVTALLLGTGPALRRWTLLDLERAPRGRVLDVGCGDGERLELLRRLGFEVIGHEPDPAAAAAAARRGIEVFTGDLEALAARHGRFDHVIANHVVEHVHEPAAFLRRLHDLMAPGGRLAIITPNADGIGHRTFGEAWRGLEPPRHLHVFNQRSLARLAAQAGLPPCEITTTFAQAEFYGLISTLLAHRVTRLGQLPLGRLVTLHLWLPWWLARAKAAWLRDAGAGDEIMLVSRRPGTKE